MRFNFLFNKSESDAMKSESIRHNTIKIKNKKQLHVVLMIFNSESGGVRNLNCNDSN